MDSWVVSLFGSLGSILSVLQYVSPVPTFYRIVKNKSTEEFESLPYICTVLNSCLWTYIVNGFGAALEAIYVLLFIHYAPPKKKARTAVITIILNVDIFGGAVLATYYGVDDRFRAQVVGMLCLTPMVAMYASPLAVLRDGNYVANHLAKLVPVGVEQCWEHHSPDEVSPYVLLGYSDNSKSVEYMPFGLSFVLFLTGGVWTIYAVLVHDYFLGVPNGIGFIFGAIQLVVYCIYRNYKGLPKILEESIEEGTTHEPLLH